MASGWKTKTIIMEGGTRLDLEPVLRDATLPGSLIDSQNMEAGKTGGYRRIKGYALYESSALTGSGRVLGCFVYNNGVLACRGSAIYFSSGSGWSADIAPSARTNAGQYRAAKYRWSSGNFICLVDGVNSPVRFNATTGTNLTNAPTAATCVIEYQNHLFFGKGGTVTFSAPDDDTTYTAGAGGGSFVIGDTVQNFAIWRDKLYIFCENSIHRLSGNNLDDFELAPVTGHIGCTFPDTVQEVGGDILFLAPDGIRSISATEASGEVSINTISNPLRDFITENVATYEDGRICAVTVESKSQYRLFYALSTVAAASTPGFNACLVHSSGGIGYEFFKLKGIQAVCADHGQINSGNDELIIHGDFDGFIYKQETGDNFNTANISAYQQIPFLVFDDPAVRKIIHRARVYVEVEGGSIATLTAQLFLDDDDPNGLQPQPSSVDITASLPGQVAIYGFTGGLNGGSKYGTAVYGRGVSPLYRLGLYGGGFNASLKLSSDDTKPSYAVKTIIFEYSLGARQ